MSFLEQLRRIYLLMKLDMPQPKIIHMPHPSNPYAARNAMILTRFNAGESLQSIGDSYGITRERVRQLVQKAGAVPRIKAIRERRAAVRAAKARARRLREEDRADRLVAAIAMVKEGSSKARATRAYNLPANTLIGDIVHSNYGRWQKDREVIRTKAVLVYQSGKSLHETSVEINRSPAFVIMALDKAGVPRRHGGWRRGKSRTQTSV